MDTPKMPPQDTQGDENSRQDIIGKLRWRCRRGMRELDRAMLGYLDHHYMDADDDEKKSFHALLEVQDPELMRLVNGTSTQPEFAQIVAKIRATLTA